MDCPACAQPVKQHQGPDGGIAFSCPQCGWGTNAEAKVQHDSDTPRPSIGLVIGLWPLAWLIVLGPYLALRFGIPAFADTGVTAFEDASARIVGLLDIHYWWIFAIYLFLAAVFTPTYDSDKTGWFGGYIDNPFSFEDDWERQKRAWFFMLLPGKTVLAAFVMTYRFITIR